MPHLVVLGHILHDDDTYLHGVCFGFALGLCRGLEDNETHFHFRYQHINWYLILNAEKNMFAFVLPWGCVCQVLYKV